MTIKEIAPLIRQLKSKRRAGDVVQLVKHTLSDSRAFHLICFPPSYLLSDPP